MGGICPNRSAWGKQVADAWPALEAGGTGGSGGDGEWLVTESMVRLVSVVEAGAGVAAMVLPEWR